MSVTRDTIVAIATARGHAGIGVIRLSGPRAATIVAALVGRELPPGRAVHARFHDHDGDVIDDGVVLRFVAPRSYTGEDVVELQAHGNPHVLERLLQRCLALGARRARPGEFTERAFLNDKLDLAQAEAVADLIAAGSDAAARAARRSLEGALSRRVEAVVEPLLGLRVYVEAALDFPDEDIDFLAAPELAQRLDDVRRALAALRVDAERGRRLNDGLHAVIVGAPNAGKSTLLNALAGEDRAIVTPVPGTTRDLLRETVLLDGVALTLVDTAGLRESADAIEQEGIRRARAELAHADVVLAVLDGDDAAAAAALRPQLPPAVPVLWLHNQCDRHREVARGEARDDGTHLWLSAKVGTGLPALRARLQALAGQDGEGGFTARQRHLDALAAAAAHLDHAQARLAEGRGELAAEELRLVQARLGEITGQVDADALLGRIFASFCLGK